MSLIRRSDKGAPLSAADHDANLKRLEGFADLAALLADRTERSFYAPGDVVQTRAEGFRYRVVGEDVGEAHVTTAGGVQLLVLPGPDGAYAFEAWAPVGDGATDDYPVLRRALDTVPIGAKITFTKVATYLIGKKVIVKKKVHLYGTFSGQKNDLAAVKLKWPVDVPGLKFERHDTYDGEIVSSTTGADGSIIEGLWVEGGLGSRADAHGIHAVCRILVTRCCVRTFSGDGIHIYATTSHGDNETLAGNANCAAVSYSLLNGNRRHGMFLRGNDTNAGVYQGIDASSNGRFGICDRSFLGNTHIGHHTETNGNAGLGGNPARHSSFVSYGGLRYTANPAASEAQLVVTEPGTNAAVWVQTHSGGPAGTVPTWTADQPEGTYFHGGAYRIDHESGRNVVIGCYSEGNQGGSYVRGPAVVIGGIHAAGFTRGGVVGGTDGNFLWASGIRLQRSPELYTVVPGGRSTSALEWAHENDNRSWDIFYQTSTKNWQIRNGGLDVRVAAYMTSTDTTYSFGTSAPIEYIMGFPTLGVGSGGNARRMTHGYTTAPTTGDWARGDIVWNRDPSAGGHAGWICVQPGTPGTWKTFGNIAP